MGPKQPKGTAPPRQGRGAAARPARPLLCRLKQEPREPGQAARVEEPLRAPGGGSDWRAAQAYGVRSEKEGAACRAGGCDIVKELRAEPGRPANTRGVPDSSGPPTAWGAGTVKGVPGLFLWWP